MKAKKILLKLQNTWFLHIAPEGCFVDKFRKICGNKYIPADLEDPRAIIKIDVMSIPFADQSFDCLYCSHVLEHVKDDKLALKEFLRVLKIGGWAIFQVPIVADSTFEDSGIIDPEERIKIFGQIDHVRNYGPDFLSRLRDAGFNVEVVKVSDLVADDNAERMGLTAASGDIYFCKKNCHLPFV